jgi:RNA polymerase sigma-70 factor, ECF subfamily
MLRFATLATEWTAGETSSTATEEKALQNSRQLDQFLSEIERRAFRMAQVALRDPDDALDAVQDAMLKLCKSYGTRPSEEWRPLFFRILQNGIRDVQRRRTVRRRLMSWLPGAKEDPDGEAQNPLDQVADPGPTSTDRLMQDEAMKKLETALAELPGRQREAFMLRNFEGLDVAQTATAMGCSEGSVKTHYSRAVHTLRGQLGEVW